MARPVAFALAFLLALPAAPHVSAQGAVHVVDWLGGPGSQFLESHLLVLDQSL
jgi:hypothetical protein